MRFLKKAVGKIVDFLVHVYSDYKTQEITHLLGGGKRRILYPFTISGLDNIVMSNNVSIGIGSTIFTTGAKLIFKGHFVSGPHLTIITGDHMSVVGKFLDEVTTEDKKKLDPDSN